MSIRSVIAGASFLATFIFGAFIYGQVQYRSGQMECQTAQYVAELEAFRDESERLATISADLQEWVTGLSAVKPTVIERYTRVEVEKHLPADCRIDSERLQRINEGISKANATR